MLIENVANKTNEVAELDLVFINEKEVMTDSLIVADVFGKDHKNVLRDIAELTKQAEGFGGRLNFELSEYTNSRGRKYPKYVMDKDAFLMLVMGYRGDKATEIRYRYIQAFNAMHKHITEQVSLQDRLFHALQKEDASFAKGSLGGTLMQERKIEKPINGAEIKGILKRLQVEIDYVFTDNKKIEH